MLGLTMYELVNGIPCLQVRELDLLDAARREGAAERDLLRVDRRPQRLREHEVPAPQPAHGTVLLGHVPRTCFTKSAGRKPSAPQPKGQGRLRCVVMLSWRIHSFISAK